MDLKLNLFPIEFSEGRIRLWKLGNANDADAPQYRELPNWTENGSHYFWPRKGDVPPAGGSLVEIEPYSVPGLAQAIVQHILLETGTVEITDGALVAKVNGAENRLEILPPLPGYAEFYLSIAREPSSSSSKASYISVADAYNAFKALQFDNGHGTRLAFTDLRDEVYWKCQESPGLYFRSNGIVHHADKWEGLQEFGPLTHLDFRDREIECLVIAPWRKRGGVNRFLGDLREGTSSVDAEQHFNRPWSGWAEVFKFKSLTTYNEWIRRPGDWNDIEHLILEKCSEKNRKTGKDFDLVLISVPSRVPKADELAFKARLAAMGLGIPAQAFQIPYNDSREWVLSLRELALNGYVKMGGKPWLLPSDQHGDRLVVIGVGSTDLQEGVAGFCTLFQRDGTFRLGNASYKPSQEDWRADLAEFVEIQVAELAREDNWKEGDRVELIFHLPDASYFESVEQLKAILEEKVLANYNPTISFLLIDYDHSRWQWDLARRGRGREETGAFVPRRGQSAIMEDWSLIQLRGMDHPRVEGNPLRVCIHPASDNPDIEEFTRQVFRFAAISWRHYDLGELPATLEYGNVLTEQLLKASQFGKLRELLAAISGHPDLKTWFL